MYVNDLQYASNLLDPIMFGDDISICNNEIKRSESIKFLGVFLDENLTWKDHIRYLENKIAKNIGLLFRSKPYLTKNASYRYITVTFIPTYLTLT